MATKDILEPKTRLEHFLGRIAENPNAEELEPKTRLEGFLNEIAENKGQSGGGQGSGSPGIKVIRPENVVLSGDLVVGVSEVVPFDKLDMEIELGDIFVVINEDTPGLFTCKILGASEEGETYSFFEALAGVNPESISPELYTLASNTSAAVFAGPRLILPSSAKVILGVTGEESNPIK